MGRSAGSSLQKSLLLFTSSYLRKMEFSKRAEPGDGWANLNPKQLVVIEEGGRAVTRSDIENGFPTDFPRQFVQSFCDSRGFPFSFENFSSVVCEVLDSYFISSPFEAEYSEFRRSGRSNDREMKWDIMSIEPNTSFRLHAHPNIELIYVIKGAINEFRYEVRVRTTLEIPQPHS